MTARKNATQGACSCCSSESSVSLPASRRCRLNGILLWDQPLVQSLLPAEVRPVSLRSSRYAVGRFLGFAVFPQRGSLATVKLPDDSSLRA
jgi:hypothetical protein